MSMTYQQQYLLDGVVGRDAILNLTARHNRCYSSGDREGWVATFRYSGAQFTRNGEAFTDLRAAFDGGGRRLVTVDHEISVDGVEASQQCVALLFAAGPDAATLCTTGAFRDRLIYERGSWYFASRELQWDSVPSQV